MVITDKNPSIFIVKLQFFKICKSARKVTWVWDHVFLAAPNLRDLRKFAKSLPDELRQAKLSAKLCVRLWFWKSCGNSFSKYREVLTKLWQTPSMLAHNFDFLTAEIRDSTRRFVYNAAQFLIYSVSMGVDYNICLCLSPALCSQYSKSSYPLFFTCQHW